jgi:hypothetical protein
MLIKLLRYIIILSLVISLNLCREPFDMEQIDTNQKVLVVEGLITNEHVPYHIRLSQALPFTAKENIDISGAMVWITDNTGASYVFKEKGSGDYVSDTNFFIGEIGKIYTLKINTPDGLAYESRPCGLMSLEANIDSVYGSNEYYLTAKGENDLTDKYENVLQLYTDVSYHSGRKLNSRFETVLGIPYAIHQMNYVFGPRYTIEEIYDSNGEVIGVNRIYMGEGLTDSFDIVTSSYLVRVANKLPILTTNTDYQNSSKIEKVPLTYINPKTSTIVADATTTYIYSSPWVVQLKMFSISDETFDFYYKIIKQLEGKNSMFEPIPVQLIGNIKCITDTTKPVFGFFEVSSVKAKFINVDNAVGNIYKVYPGTGWPVTSVDTIDYEVFLEDGTPISGEKKKKR